jgi:hypothetical protein
MKIERYMRAFRYRGKREREIDEKRKAAVGELGEPELEAKTQRFFMLSRELSRLNAKKRPAPEALQRVKKDAGELWRESGPDLLEYTTRRFMHLAEKKMPSDISEARWRHHFLDSLFLSKHAPSLAISERVFIAHSLEDCLWQGLSAAEEVAGARRKKMKPSERTAFERALAKTAFCYKSLAALKPALPPYEQSKVGMFFDEQSRWADAIRRKVRAREEGA